MSVLAGAVVFGCAGSAAAQGIFQQATLSGDWGGLRKELADEGMTIGLTDVAETLSNPVGGFAQETIYEGLVTGSLDLDLAKIFKWPGAAFHVDGYEISGRGLSENAIGNLLTVSSIEALPTWRLHELWLQQTFSGGKGSLRIGQIAFDDEFYISQYATMFINSTFGFPDMLSSDLPGGGPGYPFAVPGARLRVAPTTAASFAAAVFNGDPAPPGPGNPQLRNSAGTNFLIGEGGTLWVAEFAYGFDVKPDLANPLGDVKLGGWYHSGDFSDLGFDPPGVASAGVASAGPAPAEHDGDYGLYAVIDKMFWQPAQAATQGLGGFLRVGGAPGDRNLIDLEVDTGLAWRGPLSSRPLDALGVAFAYARIGGAARTLSAEEAFSSGVARPIRDYEAVLEATYQVMLAPWWVLQPDFQVIFHPGGNIAGPPSMPPTEPIPNAVVVGLRSTITF